jgi:exopolysaccharide production protein ExoZ
VTQRTKSSSTVVGVQYFRGLAAVLVVVDHASGIMGLPRFLGEDPGKFLVYGAVGVPIFFVISGFIMAVISLDRDFAGRLTINEFYRRRFVRIVPFMWGCVVVFNLLRYVGTGAFDWGPFWRAMVLWPVGDLRPNVLWTLRYELLFYLLFGFAMLGAVHRRWLLVAWFLSPFLWWFLRRIAPESLLPSAAIREWVDFFAGNAAVPFGAGFGLGLLYIRDSRAMRPRFTGGFPSVLAFGLSLFLLLALINPAYEDFWVSAAVSGVCAVLVWFGICLRPSGGWMSDFGHFLGDASYSIYLVHNAVLLVLLTVAAKMHLNTNIWVIYGGLVAAAIAGGCAVHVLVERPVVRIAGNVLAPRNGARKAATIVG